MRSSTPPSPRIEVHPHESVDQILWGSLKIIQSAGGYRFGIDSVLLAEFALKGARGLVVDLGTGCGIVALAMLGMGARGSFVGVEIQETLANQALRNALLNGFQERFNVVQADIRRMPLKKGIADMVVANPPFRRPKSALVSPNTSKAIAKSQILLTIDELIAEAALLLKSKGRFCIVYPAQELASLIQRLRRNGLEPKRMVLQHPTPSHKAELVFLEAQKGARPGMIIEPPIFGQGRHSNIGQG